jgi:hypothetical protein
MDVGAIEPAASASRDLKITLVVPITTQGFNLDYSRDSDMRLPVSA